jgi:hypothetical protein
MKVCSSSAAQANKPVAAILTDSRSTTAAVPTSVNHDVAHVPLLVSATQPLDRHNLSDERSFLAAVSVQRERLALAPAQVFKAD